MRVATHRTRPHNRCHSHTGTIQVPLQLVVILALCGRTFFGQKHSHRSRTIRIMQKCALTDKFSPYMTVHEFLVLIGKIIVGVFSLALMIWLAWTREKNRYKGLKGYAPTLKLGDGGSAHPQEHQGKTGMVVEFRKEEHNEPIDQLEPFGRRKRKLRFGLKVSRVEPDEQG